MKAIIIENEYEVDVDIQAFLKDNPTLFSEVQEELYCLHRSREELLPGIISSDAILVASTWMYKDQLEDFLDVFISGKITPKEIFAHNITDTLNNWVKEGWKGEKQIMEKIFKMLDNGWIIYSFHKDYNNEKEVFDDLNCFNREEGRYPFTYIQVKYSKEHNFFYFEGEEDKILENKLIFNKYDY